MRIEQEIQKDFKQLNQATINLNTLPALAKRQMTTAELTPLYLDVVPALNPDERVALTVALGRVRRGAEILPNTATLCILALARITGTYDYTKREADNG